MLQAGCIVALHRYFRRPLQPALAHRCGFGGLVLCEMEGRGANYTRRGLYRVPPLFSVPLFIRQFPLLKRRAYHVGGGRK